MFDLFRSRDKAVRILLGGLLLVVALSMLTYLIPTYDTGATSGGDQVVAVVGKETIPLTDVQRLIQNNLRQRQLPPEILPTYIPQMVNDLITERALAYEASRLGFQVSDADLSDAIRQSIPALFPDGNFVGKEAYAQMLSQENLTIPEFEADLRRQILITRLRNIAAGGIVVTPAEIEQTYKTKNEKVKIQWVKITDDKFKKEAEPSTAELQAYYNANKATYQTPERKNLILLVADQTKLEQSLTVPEADLRRQYDQNKDQYRTPERVDVRHILLNTTGKTPDEVAKIKAKAEDLLKQVKAGADIGELAKKNSEDPGSAQNGGEYKGVVRGQMLPEFEQAAFSLKPGDSALVKTAIGYHVIKVEKHEDARLRPFEEVKDEMAAQWKKQRATDMMQQIADKAQTALKKDPAHPDLVAAQFGMQVVKADGIEAGKPVPEVGNNTDFDQAIAPLRKGEVSQPVALPSNRIVIAELTDIIPPKPASFEEVQSKIHDTVLQNRLRMAVQKHAQEVIDKAKSMNGDIEKAAKSLGLEAKMSDPVNFSGNIEGLGSTAFLANVMKQPVGSFFGPFPLADGTVVGKVVEHVMPDPAKLATERDSIREEIKSDRLRDRNALFEAGLRDTLTKQGKIKINKEVVDRLVNDFANNRG